MRTLITGFAGGMLAAIAVSAGALAQGYVDPACQQYASQQAGAAQAQANNNAVGSTLGGALLGAGIGAAIGGGRGAAIGAGAGAVTGAGAGAAQAQDAGNQAYWNAYNYCMSTRSPAPAPSYQPGYGQPQPGYGQQPYNPYNR
jgi:hypothetical protein